MTETKVHSAVRDLRNATHMATLTAAKQHAYDHVSHFDVVLPPTKLMACVPV
jgi:hypothetical protein